jgi:glycosyltransferase involved in cell wall biosynthesis
MHVGLNLIYLVPGQTGGTETYARELIPALMRNPGLRLTAFINREATAAPGGPWHELVDTISVPVCARSRAQWVRGEQQLLPRLAQRAGVDLLHSLANTSPVWGTFRRVVTIHDLNHRIVPQSHTRLLAAGMRVLVPLAARRAHRIIVDAASTRGDLERLLGIAPAKVDVVPLGLGTSSAPAAKPAPEIRGELRAASRAIVLSASAKRRHKNLARLIGALALIPTQRRPLLVLSGYSTPHERELRRRAAQLGLSEDVRFLDWVDQPELEGLYAVAAGFVFPSLYEGFGFPVLEAMARGVPVACSGRGALDEVAGEAALRFDPESERSIAQAIERLLSDPAEAERLSAAGRERAARFTWAATATRTLAAYERALER